MSIEVELLVECLECGSNVESEVMYNRGWAGSGFVSIIVKPCKRCIEIKAEEKAEQHEPG